MHESVFRGSGELSLQALSLPHTWCCLGIPSKTALPPLNSLLFLLLEDTPMCVVTITSGESWGLRAQGPSTPPLMHHLSHCSLELSSSPPSGIVATLYGGPHIYTGFLLLSSCHKVDVSVKKPLVASGCEPFFLLLGVSRGDKHSQTPEKMFCLTRGSVMVRSGTAHPKVLKIC